MQLRTFAAAALVLVGTTTTVRAENKIRVCVNLRSGELRLLTTQSCPAGFTQVAWTLNVPTGQAGPTGSQGPAGPAGPQGPQGAAGAKGATGSQGVVGPQGVAGLQGAAGPQGPQGPAGSAGTNESPFTIVDQNGQEVGVASDPLLGAVFRRIGNDTIVFYATTTGAQAAPIDFYHSTSDCSDSRYLPSSGAGFAYYAMVRGDTTFYTKADWSAPLVPILAYEHVDTTADATQPGVCTPYELGLASIGVVTTATDPVLGNLALPLRLK